MTGKAILTSHKFQKGDYDSPKPTSQARVRTEVFPAQTHTNRTKPTWTHKTSTGLLWKNSDCSQT